MALHRNLNEVRGGMRHLGTPLVGVLGSAVPSTGAGGRASLLYNDVTVNALSSNYVELWVTEHTFDSLRIADNGAYTATVSAPGTYTAAGVLYVDGVAQNAPAVVLEVTFGEVGSTLDMSFAIVETGADTVAFDVAIAAAQVTATLSIVETGEDLFSVFVGQAVVTPGPTTPEPITLEEAKQAARISNDVTAFDAALIGIAVAARRQAEHETGRGYVRQTKRYDFVDWPASTRVMHVFEPVSVAISWWDGAAWQTLSTAAYGFFEQGQGTSVAPALDTAWPTLGRAIGGPRVRITITAGPEDARANTPDNVKLYIKALVAHWHDNPSAASERSVSEVPHLGRLLDSEQLWN